MYPDVYRKDTLCEWVVSVPKGFKVVLEFEVFDIGVKNCDSSYISFDDISTGGNRIRQRSYCGGVN